MAQGGGGDVHLCNRVAQNVHGLVPLPVGPDVEEEGKVVAMNAKRRASRSVAIASLHETGRLAVTIQTTQRYR